MGLNLDYTGHPFYDVGLATLTAFARKRHPSELENADLQTAAEYMQRNYSVNPLKSFLTVAFPNSGFVQPAYDKQPEKREQYARSVLFAYDAASADEIDPISRLPAASTRYDVKGELPPGRAYRQHVPLLTGEGYINFFPYGDAGLPLSGLTMLAVQALPLGCAKVAGRLLAVHSDSPDLLLHFARTFLKVNLQNVQIAQTAGESKLRETSPYKPRTLLIDLLLQAEQESQNRSDEGEPLSLTAYHFTNSGQGADLQIYPLPLEVAAFLRAATAPKYRDQWQALIRRGWQIILKGDDQPRYNRLYEDLFGLPENAAAFIRRYFLRRPAQPRDKTDPTGGYDTRREAGLISWPLTELFLRKVMIMDENRIASIRSLGDALAQYILRTNDRAFFNAFWMGRNYHEVRAALIRASQREVRAGRPPLLGLDQFLAVFEQYEGSPAADWRLGRDLVLIRLLESLYQQGWLQQHAEEIPEGAEEESSVEEETE
ncbi:MAG: type I-B CRISPR-associated protein Cas8b1/Cst1 [Chloroflexota bacterium]